MVWSRIESWVAWRWSSRAVVYVVEGPGNWSPRLYPFTVSTVERWEEDAANTWGTVSLNASALGGHELPGVGPYRFTGTAGDGFSPAEAPEPVQEAYRRLAEYMAAAETHPGASRVAHDVGPINVQVARRPDWKARAIHNSGAADLLRPYRRAP